MFVLFYVGVYVHPYMRFGLRYWHQQLELIRISWTYFSKKNCLIHHIFPFESQSPRKIKQCKIENNFLLHFPSGLRPTVRSGMACRQGCICPDPEFLFSTFTRLGRTRTQANDVPTWSGLMLSQARFSSLVFPHGLARQELLICVYIVGQARLRLRSPRHTYAHGQPRGNISTSCWGLWLIYQPTTDFSGAGRGAGWGWSRLVVSRTCPIVGLLDGVGSIDRDGPSLWRNWKQQ